jgi:hypothetical protein
VYYYGGSREARQAADYELGSAWLKAGISSEIVQAWLAAVRVFGEPIMRQQGVSWAFGGNVFAYTAQPTKAH